MNYKNLIKGGFYSILFFSSLNADIDQKNEKITLHRKKLPIFHEVFPEEVGEEFTRRGLLLLPNASQQAHFLVQKVNSQEKTQSIIDFFNNFDMERDETDVFVEEVLKAIIPHLYITCNKISSDLENYWDELAENNAYDSEEKETLHSKNFLNILDYSKNLLHETVNALEATFSKDKKNLTSIRLNIINTMIQQLQDASFVNKSLNPGKIKSKMHNSVQSLLSLVTPTLNKEQIQAQKELQNYRPYSK